VLLIITRGPSVRPSDEHSFMSPFILSDLVDDADITSHCRPALRIRIAVADVLNNHVTDFSGALFPVATWPHIYIISEVGGKVKNFLGLQEIFFPHRIENFHPSTVRQP